MSKANKDNQATSESWEDSFDESFNGIIYIASHHEENEMVINAGMAKEIFREFLQSQKDRLKGEVEGLARVETGGIIGVELSGWNKALQEVLKLFE